MDALQGFCVKGEKTFAGDGAAGDVQVDAAVDPDAAEQLGTDGTAACYEGSTDVPFSQVAVDIHGRPRPF
jgi:hypothetical protein